VQQVLAILLPQRAELGAQQHELNGVEKVALPAPVPPDNHVVLGGERLNLALAPERPEPRDDDLLDVHVRFCLLLTKCWLVVACVMLPPRTPGSVLRESIRIHDFNAVLSEWIVHRSPVAGF